MIDDRQFSFARELPPTKDNGEMAVLAMQYAERLSQWSASDSDFGHAEIPCVRTCGSGAGYSARVDRAMYWAAGAYAMKWGNARRASTVMRRIAWGRDHKGWLTVGLFAPLPLSLGRAIRVAWAEQYEAEENVTFCLMGTPLYRDNMPPGFADEVCSRLDSTDLQGN